MGTDIHMNIVKGGKFLAEDIFPGRNSTWFRNLQEEGEDPLYDDLQLVYGTSTKAPEEYRTEIHNSDFWGFGYHHVLVKYFKEWFEKYQPHLDAGWVTKYEAWNFKTRGIEPEALYHELPKGAIPQDWEFIEITNKYDCSRWLYEYLIEHNIDDNADIDYWFDN